MNLYCKVSESCLSTDHPDLSWASQLVDMLGEFGILHKPLFVRILRLTLNKVCCAKKKQILPVKFQNHKVFKW